jgi:hypothetical protein
LHATIADDSDDGVAASIAMIFISSREKRAVLEFWPIRLFVRVFVT